MVLTPKAVTWPVKDGTLTNPDKTPHHNYEQFPLRCGDTNCEFKIRCYRFKGEKKKAKEEVKPQEGAGGKGEGGETKKGGGDEADRVGEEVVEVVVEGKAAFAGEAKTVGMGLMKVENDGDKKGLLTSPV